MAGLNDIDAQVTSLKGFSRLGRVTHDRFDAWEGVKKTVLIIKNLLKYGIEVEKTFGGVALQMFEPVMERGPRVPVRVAARPVFR